MVKSPVLPTLPCSPFVRLLMRAAAGALYRHARGRISSRSKKSRSATSGPLRQHVRTTVLHSKLVLTFNSMWGQYGSVASKLTLGSQLRALRLEAKLSQRDLADRVANRLKDNDRGGFDFTYLSKIENDRLVPSAAVILALAAELKGNSDELLALAGKAPADIGEMLKQSEGARMFFRSAMLTRLSEDDWKKLLQEIQPKKNK